MILFSILMVCGYVLIKVGCAPQIIFYAQGNLSYLPLNPGAILKIGSILSYIGYGALLLAIFIPHISIWAVLIAFFIGGGLGGRIGLNQIRKGTSYSTTLTVGVFGAILLIGAIIWPYLWPN